MAKDPDLEFIDHMLDLHTPADSTQAKDLDDVRAAFKRVAKLVVKKAPRTADRTLALRSIHRACMDSIFAVVANGVPEASASAPALATKPAPAAKKAAPARKVTKTGKGT